MNADWLLAHYERIADAPDAVQRLRRFILDLAVRGKLVEQDPNDEPASELLERIAAAKAHLVRAEKIKKQSALPHVANDEAPFSVPNGWEWTRIGSTAYVEMGQSPPSEHYNRTGHGIPFFQGKADFGKRYPTARYWCTQPKKYAAPGDILISVRAPVGPTNVASEQCCIGRGLAALRPHNGIDRYYLLHCLEAVEHVLAALGFGTTFVAINKNQLTGFVIPLPPLAEQHRIVAKVDELMALCDRLEETRTERETTRNRLAAASLVRLNAPDPDPAIFRNHAAFALENLAPLTTRFDQIKALRQTILNLAVRGKLVEQDPIEGTGQALLFELRKIRNTWETRGRVRKQKVKNAVADDEQYLDLPTSWAWTRLIDVGQTQTGTSPSSAITELFGDFMPFVKPADLDGNKINYGGPGLSEKGVDHSRLVPENSVLMVCIGATLGKVNKTTRSVCFNQQINSLTPFFKGVTGFVALALKASSFQEIAWSKAGTGTLPIISKGKWEVLPVPLPPLAEQHRIVAKVDELMTLCDQLEASLTTGDETRRRLLDALLYEALPARRLRGHLTKRKKLVPKSHQDVRANHANTANIPASALSS